MKQPKLTKVIETWNKPRLQLVYRWYGGANDKYVIQTPIGELDAGSWTDDIVDLAFIFDLLYRQKYITKRITSKTSWGEPPCAICRS